MARLPVTGGGRSAAARPRRAPGSPAAKSPRDPEERCRELVEAMDDVLFVVESDGRVTSLNEAFERLLGWPRGEWIGKHFAAFLHPEDLPLAAALGERVLAGRPDAGVELRFRHRSGAYRMGELRAVARRAGGVVTGLIGVGRDVTERNRAEARSRALLAIARDVAGHLDLGALFERALRSTAESMGCEGAIVFREVWQGTDGRAVADVGLTAKQRERLHACRFPAGLPFGELLLRGETVVLSRRAEAPPVLTSQLLAPLGVHALVASPLRARGRLFGALVAWSTREDAFDSPGVAQCAAIAGILTDAVAAAELDRVRAEERRLDSVLARIAEDMISSLDAPVLLARLCRVTREALECELAHTFLYDEGAGEFVPVAGDGDTTTPWDVLRTLRIPRRSVADSVGRLESESLLRVDGDDAALGAPMSAFGLRSGLVVALRRGRHLAGVLTLGRKEARFDASDERIARRIGRLASFALANAQLVSQLERAHALKSEFVAAMSHELRTPLNVILGYSDLLLEEAFGPLSAQQVDTLARVARSAANLCKLVDATLDLSRLESGRIEVDLREVAVSEIVQDVVRAQAAPSANVEFRCETDGALGRVRTDPGKLEVALGNLLSNAFKFTEKGSVTLRAVAARGGIEFSVEDTGPGIPAALQDAVFESFRQGDGSASRRHGGTGLGLYIVRQLVGVLRGTIRLESREGEGATFRLWVPIDLEAGRGAERVGEVGPTGVGGVPAEEKAALDPPR